MSDRSPSTDLITSSKLLKRTPLDTTSISPELLNIERKRRTNLFPWSGQFSPQLVEVLLRTFAPPCGTLLDPFAGSGTVLHESACLGLPVIGTEINPAACAMARIYCLMNISLAERQVLLNQIEQALFETVAEPGPSLFHKRWQGENEIKDSLVNLRGDFADEYAALILDALIVHVDFHTEVQGETVYTSWRKLKSTILRLPETDSTVKLVNCDARRLPIDDRAVDFVVTSPPYINVFNYHQQYRRSAEALGWNLLKVAQSEIGANRKHRGNRFFTVIQYCLDMTQVFQELSRVCKVGGRIIVIIGRESKVRKTRFFNGEIIAALAACCAGITLSTRQERVFLNRFGERIYEDILHFEVTDVGDKIPDRPRNVAREILIDATSRVPNESIGDLEQAIQSIDKIMESIVYDSNTAMCPTFVAAEKEANREQIPNASSGETVGDPGKREITRSR